MVIDWSNIDLETPKSLAEYVTRSSKKNQYVQKYGVPGSSKSAGSQRYQKYGEAGSSKSASPRIETLRLERPQLKLRSESGRDRHRSRNKSDRSPPPSSSSSSSSSFSSSSLSSNSPFLRYEDMDRELRNALRVLCFILVRFNWPNCC
jgi:hypothetical protein